MKDDVTNINKDIRYLYKEYYDKHNGNPKHDFSHFIRVRSSIIHHKEKIRPMIIWWSETRLD